MWERKGGLCGRGNGVVVQQAVRYVAREPHRSEVVSPAQRPSERRRMGEATLRLRGAKSWLDSVFIFIDLAQ